jgi:hypothetical protein
MTERIALKRLTQSDLTFIDWHFQKKTFGESRQKAINLNARVFVEQLFPDLLRTPAARIDVLLTVYGPGGAGAFTPMPQTRPVLNNNGKNWRLNGKTLSDDPGSPTRFHGLAPGDLALLEFRGWPLPTEVDLTFISATEDPGLHGALGRLVAEQGRNSMVELTRASLEVATESLNLPHDHPLASVSEEEEAARDEALEDAARGRPVDPGLRRRRGGPRLTPEELEQARAGAARIGAEGETLVNAWLEAEQLAGRISHLDWVARRDAAAPFDFTFQEDGVEVRMDAKSTKGDHGRKLHMSIGEVIEASAEGRGPYRIARVSGIDDDGGRLRISDDVSLLARQVMDGATHLPRGIDPNGFSIRPDTLRFGEELHLEWPQPEND